MTRARRRTKAERECTEFAARVAWLDSLLARADVGVYSIAADLTQVLYVNSAVEAIFGRPAEEFRRRPGLWLQAIDPRDRAHVGDTLSELHRDGAARHVYRVLRPDGATLWILAQSHRVDDERGNPLRFDCLFTNITRRKEVETALRDSEERFRRLAEAAPVAIAVVTARGEPIFTNDYARRLHGFPLTRLGREAWLAMIHPEDRATIARAVDTSSEWDGQYRVVQPDGQVKWLIGSRVPLRDETGQIYAFLDTAVDVTERCVAEEAHRASEANLQALIESTDDLVFSLDAALRFVTFNAAMAAYNRRVFGAELRPGMTVDEAFSPESAARWREMVGRVMAAGRLSLDFERADGRFVLLALNPIVRGGKTVGIAVFTRDIEERKRAEQMLRALPAIVMRAHEDERRAIARDLHDGVLQDLNALKLLVQSPRRTNGIDGALRDDVLAGRVDQIIRSVREVALRLRPAILDDLGLLPAVRSLASQVEADARVEVFVSAEPLGERLRAEVETASFRIVQEAIANACRHSGAKAVYAGITREEDVLVVSVRDNGSGFRLDEARRRAQESGHFGLSVMEERANALGGNCSIKSTPGVGTEVRARIPLHPPAP